MYTSLMAVCGASGYKEDDVLNVVNLLLSKGAEVNAHDRYVSLCSVVYLQGKIE